MPRAAPTAAHAHFTDAQAVATIVRITGGMATFGFAGVAGLALMGGGDWSIQTVNDVSEYAPTAAKFSVAYVLFHVIFECMRVLCTAEAARCIASSPWHGPPQHLLTQYPVFLYQRLNASAPCFCANRGYESGVYFKFVAPEHNHEGYWWFGISPEGIGAVGAALNFATAAVVSAVGGEMQSWAFVISIIIAGEQQFRAICNQSTLYAS